MTEEDRTWSGSRRLKWWVTMLGIALPVAGSMTTCALVGGKWIYSRASVEYVNGQDTQTKKDVEGKLDKTNTVIGNVRDNLIILMDRHRVESKPLSIDP